MVEMTSINDDTTCACTENECVRILWIPTKS